ncbi:heavy metal-associated isoprenylated plant protein 21 [Cinnamomum micranthum f. kanehirae]|uniref:Heavy metal-associated isoprenylated plant protein 21 n=1 Tax=Cinnamomum micranthum f. kanehirae TaxID=337451 RepID=A0A3S3MZS1_9MAGN|nr:heavy metal-associated isoprenylated plant protein 21 [Cinnamomum micranthum f. kanehirae]
MGVLDHFSEICTVDKKSKGPRSRRRPLQTVELKVKMDCDGCERRVRNAVCSLKGINLSSMKIDFSSACAKTVDVNRKQSRVTVTGYVDQNKVLNKVKSTGKRAELWPYVAANLVPYPYVAQAYDKKAPSGFVKNVVQALPSPNSPYDRLATLFSDENPHACSIM